MSLINSVSENCILPLSDLITGQSVKKQFNFLMQSQFWTKEEIIQYQNERLQQLIKHAYENVPYYKNLFKDLGIEPRHIKTKDDLKHLPLLSKSIIKKEGIERFTSSAFKKSELILSSSSGSTGEPLFYYDTRQAYSTNIAAYLRGWYWMGYRLGDKYVKLSQNIRKNPVKRLQDKMTRNLYLATNPLTDTNFEFILNEIEKYKPRVIRCYPDPLLFLARYKNKSRKYKHSPFAINTTGNTLYPETRIEIEEAFGCRIFDSYSCEGNSTVFECPAHQGYHSAEEYGISEILDEDNTVVKNGIGKLISTDLWNFSHPFIRYDTQDDVETEDVPCTCGRNLLKIKRIMGRSNDVIDIPSGKFIVHHFTSFFTMQNSELNKSVDQFQVIKRKDGSVHFKLVVNDAFNKNSEAYILTHWSTVFNTPVTIETTSEIPLTASGKRKFIINE